MFYDIKSLLTSVMQKNSRLKYFPIIITKWAVSQELYVIRKN